MPLFIKVENMSNNLTYYERQMLQYWLRTKMSLRDITKIMKRTHSVLSKELKKTSDGNRIKYRADIAQNKYENRQHKQRKGKLDKHPLLKEYVEEKIKENWSPEQIAGRLKANQANILISHESIYYYIYNKAEKYKKLHTHLRTNRIKRKKQGKRKGGKVLILQRKSIHQRPETIQEKTRFGDWESDTMEFTRIKNNSFLSVQFERKSKLVRMRKMIKKTAEETNNALINTIETTPSQMVKTITFDNGSEGAKHYQIAQNYGIETYFCDPFCSWQKGGVENTNKLIRQYLPRKTDLNNFTDYDIYLIQEKLNNRPRKSLNYQTPNEVINKMVPS